MPVITVFGGGTYNDNSPEYRSGMELGKLLAEKNFHIATGGYSGIIEAVLRGAKDFNIRRIGVTTDFFQNRQPNEYINEEIKIADYISRLNKLIEIGDAYIIMPGETGTLLEFAAVWALKEKGVMKVNKPIVCCGDQWNEVIQTMSFYSEALLERSYLIDYAETIYDVIDNISKYFG
jgi:uncharacterized protein (TIGR00725 family)